MSLAPLAALWISFLLGLCLSILLLRKGAVDFLTFFLYAAFFSIASLSFVGFISNWSTIIFAIAYAIIAIIFCIIVGNLYKIKNLRAKLSQIKLSYFDGAVFFIIIILLIIIANQVRTFGAPQINSSMDQYHWLGIAESITDNPEKIKPGFAYLLSPLLFVFKNYQQEFILVWIFITFSLKALAITQLSRKLLPIPALGLAAPLILYSFHWENYYMLYAGIVPQNIGITFTLIGFIFLAEANQWQNDFFKKIVFVSLYLTAFYFIYMPALIIMLIGLGATLIAGKLFKIGEKIIPQPFAALSLLVVGTAVARYFLFVFGLFKFDSPDNIGYYDTYIAKFFLFNYPYSGQVHDQIIWLAIIGLNLYILALLFRAKKMPHALFIMAIIFIVCFFFLKTPFLTYHALRASWQTFRYYFYIIPAIIIFSLFPFSFAIKSIGNHISPKFAKLLSFAFLTIIIPSLFVIVNEQQSYIFRDLINDKENVISTEKNN